MAWIEVQIKSSTREPDKKGGQKWGSYMYQFWREVGGQFGKNMRWAWWKKSNLKLAIRRFKTNYSQYKIDHTRKDDRCGV